MSHSEQVRESLAVYGWTCVPDGETGAVLTTRNGKPGGYVRFPTKKQGRWRYEHSKGGHLVGSSPTWEGLLKGMAVMYNLKDERLRVLGKMDILACPVCGGEHKPSPVSTTYASGLERVMEGDWNVSFECLTTGKQVPFRLGVLPDEWMAERKGLPDGCRAGVFWPMPGTDQAGGK